MSLIMLFVWGACHDLLPTKANLFKRKVISSQMCPVCNIVKESVEHIIWSCPFAADVWSCVPRRIQKSISGNRMFANLFEEMIGCYDQQELEIFVVVARWIWMRRNEVVHGGAFTDPKQLFMSAISGLEEFQKVKHTIQRRGAT
jgi:hypothetical protein